MSGVTKEFLKPEELVRSSFALARAVYDSGFMPDALLVLWRGGSTVGMIIHEFFAYKGHEMFHTVIKAESYIGIEKRIAPRLDSMGAIAGNIKPGQRVLIVDDIFDSGATVKMVADHVRSITGDIKIATLFVRSGHNTTDIQPDYFIKETSSWVVFPHEIQDLTPEEIKLKDPEIYRLITGIQL